MPFLKLWGVINGDMTGVYLFIRYTYTVFKILIAIIILVRLRKYSEKAAMLSATFFLIFSAYGMMVLSYNSIAFGGMSVALVMFINDDNHIKANISRIVSGVALAIAVLGIPYMAIIYIAFFVSVIIVSLLNRKKKITLNKTLLSCYSWNSFMYVSIGVIMSLVMFMVYIFYHTKLSQVIQTIPHIIMGDPAHKAKSLYGLTIAYFVRILIGNNHNYFLFMVYFMMSAVMLFYLFDKKKEQKRFKYVLMSCVLSILLLIVYIITDSYINNVAFVPLVLAIMLTFIMNEETIWSIFFTIVIPGIIATYAEYVASNTGFSGIAASACIPAIGSIMIIVISLDSFRNDRYTRFLIKSALCFIMCSCVYYRFTYVFWEDGGLKSLTEEIPYGVCKGLMVTPETVEKYGQLYLDTESMRNLSEDTTVLFVSDKVLWMASHQRCGSYSPLCYSISDKTDLLWDYYTEHPDKIPDVIYVQDGYGKDLVDNLVNTLDYVVHRKSGGYMIYSKNIREDL